MRWYWRRKWIPLAALTVGTALQISACQQEASLFALRTLFTTVTLPINTAIQAFLLSFG